jgi:hypothetical protein
MVVAAGAEPAVVEDEPLHSDRCRKFGEGDEPLQAAVEGDRLPHVERHRPRRRHGPATDAQVPVEPAGTGRHSLIPSTV